MDISTATFRSPKDRRQRLFGAAIILIMIVFLFFWNPEKLSITSCYFHQLTGYSCPTCGLSRSLHEIAHYNLIGAIKFHIMGPVIYLVLLLFLIKFFTEFLLNKNIELTLKPSTQKNAIFVFFGLWFFYFLIRLIVEII